MEETLRQAARAALSETPVKEAQRLLAAFEWTDEDLRFSESTQQALLRGGWPVALVDRLFRRHQQEAARLTASELTGWPQPAERTHPGVSLLEWHLGLNRVERDLRRAGGA